MERQDDIIKLVTGNTDIEDKGFVSDIKNHPKEKDLYKKVKLAWALISSSKEMPDYKLEKSFQDLQKRIRFNNYKKIISVSFRYAAILILIIGIASVIFYLGKNANFRSAGNLVYTQVVADYGQISKVILPDNSIVWLNSGSTLKYNNNYSVDNRNLVLSGQAFFEIQKNRKLPVILSAKDTEVRVLGTRFGVSAYADEDQVNIILETGKIEFSVSKTDVEKYTMTPGQIAIYDSISGSVKIKEVDVSDFTSWKEGELVFKDAPLEEVLKILERKFNIKFIKNSSKIKKSVFTATFKNETLIEILDYINYSCQINYKIDEPLTNSKQKVILN